MKRGRRRALAARTAAWTMAACAALLTGSGCVGAESLEQAWHLALTRNPALAAAGSDLAAARADQRAAAAARWPTVSAQGGYSRLDRSPSLEVQTPGLLFRSGPIFNNDQYLDGSVQLKLPLYAGGSIAAGIDAARSVADGAGAAADALTSTVKLQVAEAYVAVLRARQALAAVSASVDSLGAHVTDAAHLVDTQTAPSTDLLAARVALANAREQQVRADNAVQAAQAAYNRLLAEPLDRAAELDDRIAVDAGLAAEPLNDLVDRALRSRRELNGLSAQADALAAQARAESGRQLPQVALTGGYMHFDNTILDRRNFAMVGVGVTWSLFDGGQAHQRADALRSESRAARSRADDERSQIELQVRQAWLEVRAAQGRLDATRESVSQAAENLRMSREQYDVQLGTNTQVLDAVALQREAVQNRDDAALDLSLAQLRLAYAVGAL